MLKAGDRCHFVGISLFMVVTFAVPPEGVAANATYQKTDPRTLCPAQSVGGQWAYDESAVGVVENVRPLTMMVVVEANPYPEAASVAH